MSAAIRGPPLDFPTWQTAAGLRSMPCWPVAEVPRSAVFQRRSGGGRKAQSPPEATWSSTASPRDLVVPMPRRQLWCSKRSGWSSKSAPGDFAPVSAHFCAAVVEANGSYVLCGAPRRHQYLLRLVLSCILGEVYEYAVLAKTSVSKPDKKFLAVIDCLIACAQILNPR